MRDRAIDFVPISWHKVIMRLSLFRIVSVIILIVVAVMFTGLSGSVSAAFLKKAEKSCCDECNRNNDKSPIHCSTPDCPLFLCFSIDKVPSFALLISVGSVYLPQFSEQLHLESPVKQIFHPPKA